MTQLQVPQARRRLRAELRSARARAGLTQRDVAEAMEWSLPKLIRIESASVGISTADLRALLHHYGVVEPAEVERLVNLARAGKEQRSWWIQYREMTSRQYLAFHAWKRRRGTREHNECVVGWAVGISDHADH
jgi:transcriptional regulator with XRE-family HTH domain